MSIPANLAEKLSAYGECARDLASNEPIGWGYEVIASLSDEERTVLQGFGELLYSCGKWYLVTRKLSIGEAIEKYGPIFHEVCCGVSPCSIVFGHTPLIREGLAADGASQVQS